MKYDLDFRKTTMPESRKADYYLSCLDSSVFIDFNRSNENLISLVRISFDGYGCCNLDEKLNHLNHKDSRKFVEEMEQDKLNQEIITKLIKNAININKEHIWADALEKYGLVENG